MPLKVLKKYWNHQSFRTPQDKIIDAVLKRIDVIALLPTGGGKSVCFQIPALLQDGVCIVVSPLIALMQDQVTNLKSRGIKAFALTSGLSQDDIIALFDNLKFGGYKFLYLSPERLQSTFIQKKIKELNVNLVAIDEAHCISEWGHDFRPSYRNIRILKELKPNVNFIALTASATKEVLKDISSNLELKNVQLFKKSFYRDNLAYQIFSIEDKLYRLLQIFIKIKGSAIVYVNSRNKTKEISKFLTVNSFSAGYYHGGMSSKDKQEFFEKWISEETPIMVATNAFGMGIDKENVRVVIHLDLPNSVENYIQEAGRAGRNGKKAYAVLLQNKSDILFFKERMAASFPSILEIKDVYKRLHQNYQIAYGEFIETSFEFNLLEFSNKYNYTANKLSNTLKILVNNGIIELSDNYIRISTIKFLVTSLEVINYAKNNISVRLFIEIILRSYGGLFEQETKINEYLLAKKANLTTAKSIGLLRRLHNEKIIDYRKSSASSELFFLLPREDNIAISRVSKDIIKYINQKKRKSDALIRFVENDITCRNVQVLHYFDEKNISECGICDVCLSKNKRTENISVKIIELLKSGATYDSKEICNLITINDKAILLNLQHLLAENSIAINNHNQYYIK